MSSKGKKVMGAQMSATKNRVKDEFKQFLPPTTGVRGRGGAANAISSSATSKQTYKANSMTPYLFMGLQQMRTAGGRKALVDAGTYNFNGPIPSNDIVLSESKITSELSGNLKLACGVFVGVSFEFGSPYIHSDICGDVLESITLLPKYRYINDAYDDDLIRLYPKGGMNDISNIRVVPRGGGLSDTSSGWVYFDVSVGSIPDNKNYWTQTHYYPFNEYKFSFKFKQGVGFTKLEKDTYDNIHHGSIHGVNVFAFNDANRLKSILQHSNHAEFRAGDMYRYFYNNASYSSIYFRVYNDKATLDNGVDVSARHLNNLTKEWFYPGVDSKNGWTVFEYKSGSTLNSSHEFAIQDISFVLRNKNGLIKDSVKYTSDISYVMNRVLDHRYIYNTPTAIDYEDGKYENKMLLRVGEAVTSDKSIDLSFDGGIWTSNVGLLFGEDDISYSTDGVIYKSLPTIAFDTSVNAVMNERRYLRILSTMRTDEYNDVLVRFNMRGPSGEYILKDKTVRLVSGDIMPLSSGFTVEGSSNLYGGYKLAKADGESENRVFLNFRESVFSQDGDLNSIAVQSGGSSVVIGSGKMSATALSKYVEASFNVGSKVDHKIVVNLNKTSTGTSEATASYEFVVPLSEVYTFPYLTNSGSGRLVNGERYDSVSDLSRALDLPYVWGLDSTDSSILGLTSSGSLGSHFEGVMDVSSIDISYTSGGSLYRSYLRVSDVSLSKIVRPSFDLSFVNRYVDDTNYDMSYTLRHGDIEYTQFWSPIMEASKLKD